MFELGSAISNALAAQIRRPLLNVPVRVDHKDRLAYGLVGAWPLNDGAGEVCKDYSGFDQDGIFNNMDPASDWVDNGEDGWLLDFDGTDDYVEAPGGVANPSTDFTISLWFAKGDTGDVNDVFFCKKDADFNPGVAFQYNNSTDFFYFYINSTSSNITGDLGSLSVGEFHHLAITKKYADSHAKLYLDGESKSVTQGLSRANENFGSTQGVILGGNPGDYQSYWHGKLSLAFLYDRVLGADEILELYLKPAGPIKPIWAPFTIVGVEDETGELTVGANAGESISAEAATLGDFVGNAIAGNAQVGLASSYGNLVAAAQAGESSNALAAAASNLSVGAAAGEALTALAAGAASVIAGAQAESEWTIGESGQVLAGVQAGDTFAAAAAAYGALIGVVDAGESINALATALASMAAPATADEQISPTSPVEGNVVLRGAVRLQAALRGKIDIHPLLRGLPSTRPH